MKKLALLVLVCGVLAGCMGQRGTIGSQKVCKNDYFLGVISIAELFSPCGK